MSGSRVAVIILTYRNQEALRDLARFLPPLEAVDFSKERWEIIVVDNPAPLGNCREVLERDWAPRSGRSLPRLTVLKPEKNLGFTGGNNLGLRTAKEHRCDFAFLLNQDTDVDPGFLQAAMSRADGDARIGAVQSLLLLGQEPQLVNSWGNALHYLGYSYCGGYRRTVGEAATHFAAERTGGNQLLEIPTASGAAVLVRLKALGGADLFDEKFFLYHEDVDLSVRLRLAGWRVVVEPKSVVRHHYVFSRSVSKFRWMERNRFVVLFSSLKLPTLILLLPALVAAEVFSLFFAARGGWFSEKTAAYRDFFSRPTRLWVRERRCRLKSGRKISDRELLRTAESRILFQEASMRPTFMSRVANPLMTLVWAVTYFIIRW
jgi:GT2 family glycosyltransferase